MLQRTLTRPSLLQFRRNVVATNTPQAGNVFPDIKPPYLEDGLDGPTGHASSMKLRHAPLPTTRLILCARCQEV
jgi:hypothetical protein